MVEDFKYELSSKVKVKSYPIEVDSKVIEETITDLKKRFGKVSYPEVSEASDNLFGELHSADPDFKREHAFIAIENVEKKEQKKFIGLKKDEQVEFEISKSIFTTKLTQRNFWAFPQRKRRTQRENIFSRSIP